MSQPVGELFFVEAAAKHQVSLPLQPEEPPALSAKIIMTVSPRLKGVIVQRLEAVWSFCPLLHHTYYIAMRKRNLRERARNKGL